MRLIGPNVTCTARECPLCLGRGWRLSSAPEGHPLALRTHRVPDTME